MGVTNNEKDAGSETLKLLGQEIPINIYTCIVLVAIVVAFTLMAFRDGNPAQFTSQFVAAFYQKGGVVEQEYKALGYRFWTPGADTLDQMKKSGTTFSPDNVNWYRLDEGDATLSKFAQALKARGVQGYDRTYGWGEGTVGLKPGWTWEVTVPAGASFTVKDLVDVYQQYFHRDRDIYVETYRLGETRFPFLIGRDGEHLVPAE